jgi:two-component system NtrC family response regulator
LRDRQGDAVLLAHAFAKRFASEQRRKGLGFSDDALRAIDQHRWPGNVRELQNVIKRAVIMAEGERLTAEDLGLATDGGALDELDLRTVRERAERQAVVAALARVDGNIVRAAELLGVSRPTLYDLMAKLQIK